MPIVLKSEEEIEEIAQAGRIIQKIFDQIEDITTSGKTTESVGEEIKNLIINFGGRPAFLGYRGFPGPACISINDEVVHGIPGSRVIKEGDLVKIDVGVEYHGFYADAARSIIIGENRDAVKILEVTKEALDIGIRAMKIGIHLSDVSNAIETYVEKNGFSVVRELTGHGVGCALHEDPPVPNFGSPGLGPKLEAGMVLAIEPMVNTGSWETAVDHNGWTILTKDGSLSAHFEDTVAITQKGIRILTRRFDG